MTKKFIIIDGNALVHRAFHALPMLTTKEGKFVNAAYGFTLVLLKMIKELKPDYLICTFDTPAPTFRHNEYKDYKAKRIKAPQELYDQIPLVKEILKSFDIPIYEKEGFEADDLIGSIAKKISKDKSDKNIETIIVTGDLDALQLINKNTKVYTLKRGIKETIIYDEAELIERYELRPEQMIDFKGLRGDPSDNIPGVPGIGEKTAIKLLKEFGSIENLYKTLEKEAPLSIKPKLKEILFRWKNQAFFSKKLATIKKDIPLELNLEKCAFRHFNRGEVKKLFEKLEFYSLIKKIPSLETNNKNENLFDNSSVGSIVPLGLWSQTADRIKTSQGKVYSTSSGAAAKPADGIKEKIEKLYQEKTFSKKVYEMEKKLVSIIQEMEKTGIKIDSQYLKKLSSEFSSKLKNIEAEIYKLSGAKFNINSSNELRKILFEKLKISTKSLKKTPGGLISTSASELLKIKNEHPIVDLIEKYREITKLKSTYTDALPKLINPQTGRIHATFDQLGTATGRLSSSNPNLQNIPIRSKVGRKIRKAFIAKNDWCFLSADYSQIELRIVASMAKDKKMIKAFKEGKDIHRATASEIYQIPLEKVSPEARRSAKALNFGIIYGMSVFGFSQAAGVDRDRARKFIDDYMIRFKRIAEYIEEAKIQAKEKGYAETLFGRRRYLPDLYSSNRLAKAAAERAAINSPIQGTAADIIKLAMIKTTSQLNTNSACLLLQIHDELVFEVKKEKINETAKLIKNIMENVCQLTVPLKVDISIGENLGEMEKWE